MRKTIVALLAALTVTAGAAQAATFSLAESLLYRDGVTSAPFTVPTTFAGLGLTTTVTGGGAHNVVLYLDAEIDEPLNSFFNELGSATGTAAAGQSWQIGDPFADNSVNPNIYDLSLAGSLTNSDLNGGQQNDVALALGWSFTLAAGQTATLQFSLSDVLPASGFYLTQFDPNSFSDTDPASLYFSSSLDIRGGGPEPVPEPSTILLLGAGLAGLGLYGRKRKQG